jgi:hypothetical protein
MPQRRHTTSTSRGSAHGRVEERPGGGSNDGYGDQGVGGANDDCNGDGLAGALTPATKKGRPTGGWGHAAAVAPVAVHAGAPATTMAPTTRSREAAAAT